MNRLLVVVDYQNDFVNGALGFEEATKLDSRIADKIREYLKEDNIVFLRDTHKAESYNSSLEGQHLPIPHCIEDTDGHDYYGEVGELVKDHKLDANVLMLQKNTFGSKHIGNNVEAIFGEPSEILVVGLVTDKCVICNAVILQAYFPNAPIHIDCSMTDSGNKEMRDKALDVMEGLFMTIDNRTSE